MPSRSSQAAGVATVGLSLGTAAAAGLHAPNWVWIATGIAAVLCLVVALGLYFLPSQRHSQPSTGIKAGHAITAGGDIEADGPIEAGQNVQAAGNIRSSTQSSLLEAIATHNAHKAALGHVNPLVGHFRIEQFATPLQHDEQGCVVRVVIAPDCPVAAAELRTEMKDKLKDALSTSSLETWGSTQVGANQATTPAGWLRSDPNSGQIATFKRHWGTVALHGSALWARATLQLPPGFQFGSRVVLVLDLIERSAETPNQSPRLSLSLHQLHALLHTLATTAIDEIGSAIFPLLCEQTTPAILGPNYQINFGDRCLNTFVELPDSFERPQDAHNSSWAEINTPGDRDSRDLLVRDIVIRDGIQKTLRNNGYDRIEEEIARLPFPA